MQRGVPPNMMGQQGFQQQRPPVMFGNAIPGVSVMGGFSGQGGQFMGVPSAMGGGGSGVGRGVDGASSIGGVAIPPVMATSDNSHVELLRSGGGGGGGVGGGGGGAGDDKDAGIDAELTAATPGVKPTLVAKGDNGGEKGAFATATVELSSSPSRRHELAAARPPFVERLSNVKIATAPAASRPGRLVASSPEFLCYALRKGIVRVISVVSDWNAKHKAHAVVSGK